MHRPTILATTCATLLFLALTGAAYAKPAVAVLGLEVMDTGGDMDQKTTRVASALTDALRERAARGPGRYELAPNSNKDLLEMKLLSDCADEGRRCMADIGRELNAQRLLYGKLEKRKNGYQISLKLLNVDTGRMEKSTSELIPFDEAGGAELAEWGEALYNRLTGIPEQGTLVIKANVDEGTVYVDGDVQASLSGGTARISGLAVGRHRVAVEAPGHERFEGSVNISSGGSEEILADLRAVSGGGDGGEGRPGGVSRVLFWTSLVATGASAAGMTITGLQVRGPLEDEKMAAMESLASSNGPRFTGPDACDQAEAYNGAADVSEVLDACDRGRSRAMLTNIFIGTTVLGALASTYFYYRGYMGPKASSNAERSASRKKKTDGTTVRVLPTINSDGVGAGVTIEF